MLSVVLLAGLVVCFSVDAFVDSTAYQALVKNVAVPKDLITHDSTVNGRNFFSGVVTYDLESDLDPVDVHVYLEEVPFQRYYITGKTLTLEYSDTGYHYGHVRFIRIDSLCSGDVGEISPKGGCRVNWSYSTAYFGQTGTEIGESGRSPFFLKRRC